MLQTGALLGGRYTIEGVVGQGGMGAVYRARMEALGGKRVAIKEMTLTVPDSMKAKALEQFRTEATMLANLDHPNLVQVSDYFEEDGRYYLVMAFVDGQTLAEMLRANEGPFRPYEVLEWAKQLCSVLEYLHTRNPPIIFRDLKPSNIMVDANNRIRLIDFGIAKNFSPDSATCTFLQGMGTAGYAPLEQYGGAGSTDPRSDQYALGATLYHLLTGQVPVNPIEIVSLGVTLTPPRQLNPSIPPALERAIMRALGVRQEERFPTIAEFLKALNRVGNDADQDTDNLGTVALNPVPTAPVAPTAPAPPIGSTPLVEVASPTAQLPATERVQPFWMATAVGMLCIGALAVYRLTPQAATTVEVAPTPVAVRSSATPPPKPGASKTTPPPKPQKPPKPTPTPAARNTPRPTPTRQAPREIVVESRREYPQATRRPRPERTPEPVATVTVTPTPEPEPRPEPQVAVTPATGPAVLPGGWVRDKNGRMYPPQPNGEPVPMKDGVVQPPFDRGPGGGPPPGPEGGSRSNPLGY